MHLCLDKIFLKFSHFRGLKKQLWKPYSGITYYYGFKPNLLLTLGKNQINQPWKKKIIHPKSEKSFQKWLQP